MRTILAYPSHPEHLAHEEWHDLADFCVQAIKDLGHIQADDNTNPSFTEELLLSSRGRPSRSATPVVRSTSVVGRLNGNPSHSPRDVRLKASAEDVTLCLKHLASASNGPIFEKAQVIVDTLLDTNLLSAHSDLVKQAAFQTINTVLSRVHANDVSLSLRTIEALVPIIRRCWSTKSASLKEHMLVSLLLGEPYLPQLMIRESEDQTAELLSLLDTMREEYCRRHERDQLQISDLDLAGGVGGHQTERPLSIQAFRLQFGAVEAESSWCLIHVTASIVVALSGRREAQEGRANPTETHPTTKKRKTENPVDSLFQRVRLSALTDKIYALQVLCFVFDSVECESSILQGYIEMILQYVSDKSNSLCSWAMLALTRYAISLSVFNGAWSDLCTVLQDKMLHAAPMSAPYGYRYGELWHDI